MMAVENVIGQQEDWANFITNVEMLNNPFLDWLPVGSKPTRPLYDYQVDKFGSAVENSQLDGAPYQNFESGAENRGRLKSLIGFYSKKLSISELAQDFTNDAGVADQAAYEMKKKSKELANDMEVQYLEDADHREDNKVVGYKSRGAGSWVASAAQALYPVPAAFLTPAASIVTTSIATVTEAAVRTMLQSSWNQAHQDMPMTAFVGMDLKTWYADRQYYIPSSASTQSTGVVSQSVFKDSTVTRQIDFYRADGVQVDLVLTRNLVALTGSTTAKAGRGYYLHRPMWELRWGMKPKWTQLPKIGTSYEYACEAIAMLVCKNPLAEAAQKPT